MGLGDLTNKAKEFMGKEENQDKINEHVDKAQEQHGGKLGQHGDKVNDFVDNQQEQRFGGGEGGGGEGQGDGQGGDGQNQR